MKFHIFNETIPTSIFQKNEINHDRVKKCQLQKFSFFKTLNKFDLVVDSNQMKIFVFFL